MKMQLRVLLVNISKQDTDAVLSELKQSGYEAILQRIDSLESLNTALKAQAWDVVIFDIDMPCLNANDALRLVWESELDIPFIVLTDDSNENTALNLVKKGADDYIVKTNLKRLTPIVEKELYVAGIRREQRKAEIALRQSAEFSDNLLNNSPNPIVVLDPDTSIRYVNPAMQKLTGFSRAEVIGKKAPYPWWPEKGWLEYSSVQEKGMKTGAHRVEGLFQKKSGEPFSVELTSLPFKEDDHIKYHISNWVDITERKRAQQEIEQNLDRLNKSVEQTIQAMALISEVRDPYNAGHQRRVTQICSAIAQDMGLTETTIEYLRLSALIHDIGKIHIPSEILSKPNMLTQPEFEMIKAHPQVGFDILKTIDFPGPIAQIVLQHHERLDGSGYPSGLNGSQIMPEAKILAVADVVEAMSSHRPYRPAHGLDKALLEVLQHQGTLYDQTTVEVCIKLFSIKGFKIS